MIKRFLKFIRYHLIFKHKFKFVGKESFIGKNIICANRKNITLGYKSTVSHGCILLAELAEIKIGNYVMIAPEVVIVTGNHRTDIIGEYMANISNSQKLPENDQPVVIEDDVWIGARAIILKGVTIGRGSIIGAGAIVMKNVPPYSIYVGTRVIKSRFTEEQIIEHERLLAEKYGGKK